MEVKIFRPWKQVVFPKHFFEFHICPLATRTFYVYLFKTIGITIKLPGYRWREFQDIGWHS